VAQSVGLPERRLVVVRNGVQECGDLDFVEATKFAAEFLLEGRAG